MTRPAQAEPRELTAEVGMVVRMAVEMVETVAAMAEEARVVVAMAAEERVAAAAEVRVGVGVTVCQEGRMEVVSAVGEKAVVVKVEEEKGVLGVVGKEEATAVVEMAAADMAAAATAVAARVAEARVVVVMARQAQYGPCLVGATAPRPHPILLTGLTLIARPGRLMPRQPPRVMAWLLSRQ